MSLEQYDVKMGLQLYHSLGIIPRVYKEEFSFSKSFNALAKIQENRSQL